MRVSTSVGYGLLAIGYIAQHKDERIILSDRIAEEYDIPLEYLLRIMQLLVKRRVLKSKRGPGGGFSLGRPLNKITVLDVVEAIGKVQTDANDRPLEDVEIIKAEFVK